MEKKVIEYFIEDGILFSEIPNKIDVNKDIVKIFIQLRHQISGENHQYWCNDIKNVNSYSIEARNYAEKHGQDLLYACAVIVHSKITKLIFNVFLKLRTPKIPFQSFTNKEEAVAWLTKIKSENERS